MEQNNLENEEKKEKSTAADKSKDPNKITAFEFFVFLILVLCIALYVSPNLLINIDKKNDAIIQTNASVFTSKVLAEFSANPKAKASKIASKLTDELNAVNKNPYTKKNPAYSLNKNCRGCVIITPDDKLNAITVEAYANEGSLLVRTVISPPSFVTFTRDLDDFYKTPKKGKKNEQ